MITTSTGNRLIVDQRQEGLWNAFKRRLQEGIEPLRRIPNSPLVINPEWDQLNENILRHLRFIEELQLMDRARRLLAFVRGIYDDGNMVAVGDIMGEVVTHLTDAFSRQDAVPAPRDPATAGHDPSWAVHPRP